MINDIFQIVNGAALGIIALFAILGFLRGFFKGTFRSVADIVVLLINVFVSVLISKGIANAIVSPETVYDILYAINGGDTEGTLAEIVEQMESYLHSGEFFENSDLALLYALFATILAPIIFVLVFIIMSIILKIVKGILVRIFIPKTRRLSLRLCGAVLGAVKNAMFWVILLAPIAGLASFGISTVNDVMEVTTDENGVSVADVDLVETEQTLNSGVFSAIRVCGGRVLFNSLSTTSVGDVEVSLSKEGQNAVNIYKSIIPLTEMESTNFTTEETEMIENAIDEIAKSEYLTALIASILSQAAIEIQENDSFFTFKLPKLGKSFDAVVDTFLVVWSTTDRVGLVDDLRTFSDVFKSTVEHGLYRELNTEDGDFLIVLKNGDFYTDILQHLHKNKRTRIIVPALANAMQSYLYEIYEEVNGEPYGTGEIVKVDESLINKDSLADEGERISIAIQQIENFSNSTKDYEYVDDIVKNGDFAALGTGLNQIRDSIFFANSYRFLLNSILHSEACAKLGIFDSNFIETATKPGTDMVRLLTSRQNLATLTMAMWDGDVARQEQSLKNLIANIGSNGEDKEANQAEVNALKEIASVDNIDRYGVRGDKGKTVSTITESLVDTIRNHKYTDKNGDGIVDQADIDIEAADIAHVISIISNAHSTVNGAVNVFDMGDGSSRTGESASQLVEEILESTIAIEMINSAVHSNGQDPYNVSDTLSHDDKASLEAALTACSGTTSRDTLEDIASVFGVNFVPAETPVEPVE